MNRSEEEMLSFLRSVFDPSLASKRITYYRTKNKRTDYGFELQQLPGGWRIYIVSQPPYGNRNTNAHPTHRLSDGGRKYVCWDTPIRSEADALDIAAKWADATEDYILKGTRF